MCPALVWRSLLKLGGFTIICSSKELWYELVVTVKFTMQCVNYSFPFMMTNIFRWRYKEKGKFGYYVFQPVPTLICFAVLWTLQLYRIKQSFSGSHAELRNSVSQETLHLVQTYCNYFYNYRKLNLKKRSEQRLSRPKFTL